MTKIRPMMERWGPNCTYNLEAGACFLGGDLFGVALAASQREKWLSEDHPGAE